MDCEGHRISDTRTLHPLIVVESTPLGTAVYELFLKNKSAILADKFRTLIIVNQLTAAALGTDGLRSLLGLLLLLLDLFNRALLECFSLTL